MDHEVKIRVVEKKVEGVAGSVAYGFSEGIGRATAWALFAYVLLFWILPHAPDLGELSENPATEEATP